VLRFKVTPDEGEPYELTAGSRDVYAWEKTGRDRSITQFADGVSVVAGYEVAHLAAVRQGRYVGALADFVAGHELEVLAAERADPTQPAP